MPLHNWATVGMVVTTSASFSLYRIVVLPAASRPSIRMRMSLEPSIRCHTLLKSMPMMLKCQLGPAIWHEMLEPNTHGTTSGAGMPLPAPCHVMPQNSQQACLCPSKGLCGKCGLQSSAWGMLGQFLRYFFGDGQDPSCSANSTTAAQQRRSVAAAVSDSSYSPLHVQSLQLYTQAALGGRDLALALEPSPLAARLHRPETATLNKTRASGHPTSTLKPHAVTHPPCPSFHLREDKVRDSQSRPS